MIDNLLPRVMTPKEIAAYLKVDEEVILAELQKGALHGFKIGLEWRCTEQDILSYVRKGTTGPISGTEISEEEHSPSTEWTIVKVDPFVFQWPRKGGGGTPQHYDEAYEATRIIDGREYTFKIGVGKREAAGRMRVRVTIWLGSRAIVEFAGGTNFDVDDLLAGVIRLKNGKQLSTQRIPDEYKNFRLGRYNSVVTGRRASSNTAVIVHRDDFKTMLDHAVIRASWKGLL